MITASDNLAQVLQAGGFNRSFVANVVVDGETVLTDVPLTGTQLTSDGTANVRNQAQATLQYSDDIGKTVVPSDLTSWMTPYATTLDISMLITAGDFSEKVLRGTFKLVGVGDPLSARVNVNARLITVGSSVTLTLADAFHVTDLEQFPVPGSPSNLASVWAEIGNLTGLPLLRNVPDTAITSAIAYQDNRLDAVIALAALLEGVPYINPANQITVQPFAWGEPTPELNIGPDGTVTSVDPDDLTDDAIYNQVVVRNVDATQTAVLATAELATGPLRYGGPFGRIPYFASSQYVTTPAQAQAYADSQLPLVSKVAAVAYSIQCLPDPRREVGDVVPFQTRDGESLVGRIQSLTLPDSGPMTLKVLVDRG